MNILIWCWGTWQTPAENFGETASENRADTLENAEIQEIFYQWKDEVQADILAMDITMQVMLRRGYDKALSFMGIQAAMLGMELLDRMQNLKEGKRPLAAGCLCDASFGRNEKADTAARGTGSWRRIFWN